MRSEEKGKGIVDSVEESLRNLVSFVIVEDIVKDGAFDKVGTSDVLFSDMVSLSFDLGRPSRSAF